MTHEQAVSQLCTYRCRLYPGLKLSLAACQARKKLSERNSLFAGIGYRPGAECQDCSGCVRQDEPHPSTLPREVKVDTKPWHFSRSETPHLCKVCGESDRTKFHPTHKTKCRVCYNLYMLKIEREKRRKLRIAREKAKQLRLNRQKYKVGEREAKENTNRMVEMLKQEQGESWV